ncbi:hypothetical protein BDQ17DRAFT_1248068 [Cyathus striatus]|nr:hypothetical protein BDQ17DRAFT_1248068 [Cyathus striatus]
MSPGPVQNTSHPTSSTPTPSSPYLSPSKHSRDRSTSRPSSRSSLRAHSPSFSLDDPVAVRHQVSTLKHTIRQHQAQLNSLENIIRSGPRPYSNSSTDLSLSHSLSNSISEDMASTSSSPPSSFASSAAISAAKMKRRSSFDVLQGIAGPDSNLPLPRKEENGTNSIPEGIPTSPSYKRASSPTRTLSRIPVASVGNARALADEGHVPHTPRLNSSASFNSLTIPSTPSKSDDLSSLNPPVSPNRRISLTPGGTTKVLADLQTGVVNARNALENTKTQLRLSQRTVAQLTRQTEDLKEGRERLRLENEGLNNVVARKERLLQEVLERARKAEGEAVQLKTQLKNDTTTSKKTIREMESALSESSALSQKSEREYLTLRDSIKHISDTFRTDLESLRADMKKREDRWKTEAEAVGKKYKTLLEEVKKKEEKKEDVKKLLEEERKKQTEVEKMWVGEVEKMKGDVERSRKEGEEAAKKAGELADELARLRRLMQTVGKRASTDDGHGSLPSEDPSKSIPSQGSVETTS